MTAREFLFILVVAVLVTETVWADDSAYKLATGPLPVKSAEALKLTDGKRRKEIVVRLTYPDAQGPFPVIVFSHGFGATKEAFGPISQHWASHGYICIHPDHADAGFLKGRQNPLGRQALVAPDKLGERVADVTAIIDELDQIEAVIPTLKDQLDRKRIGIGGHSYGACVAMLLAGATIEVGGKVRAFADPRVKCVLPISAAGTGEHELTNESWKHFAVPALYITGTRDIRPGHEAGWRREPFDACPHGDKFFLNIDGAAHISFGGKVEPFASLVKTSTLAFWDAYLKDEVKAKVFLTRDSGFNAHAGAKAQLTAK